jgi:hypothetical protein
MNRLLQTLIALDQLANAFFLGGMAGESISSRAWRQRDDTRGWSIARSVIDALFFWQPDHCRRAYEAEQQRLQQPPELRSLQGDTKP